MCVCGGVVVVVVVGFYCDFIFDPVLSFFLLLNVLFVLVVDSSCLLCPCCAGLGRPAFPFCRKRSPRRVSYFGLRRGE